LFCRAWVSSQACDAFAHKPHIEQFAVQLKVTADVLRQFVSVLEGKAVELTNENNFRGAGDQDLMRMLFMR
jgi:hypothetical protein